MQAAATPKKSTNVRFSILALQTAFRTLGATAPGLAAEAAAWLWARPIRARLRPEQAHWLDRARRTWVDAPDGPLRLYEWGQGPTALLVHGWGGHAGQLTPLVEPLIDRGFRVVAVDLPAHGESRQGAPNLLTFGRALAAAEEAAGGFEAVAAHSMGAAAVAWAMEAHGLRASRAVFVAPAASLLEAEGRFSALVGLAEPVRLRMRGLFERRLGVAMARLNAVAAAPSMTARLLVVHDEGDREVPFEEGRALAAAWPGATLVPTSGFGHHRILRQPEVIERAVGFLAGAGDQPMRR